MTALTALALQSGKRVPLSSCLLTFFPTSVSDSLFQDKLVSIMPCSFAKRVAALMWDAGGRILLQRRKRKRESTKEVWSHRHPDFCFADAKPVFSLCVHFWVYSKRRWIKLALGHLQSWRSRMTSLVYFVHMLWLIFRICLSRLLPGVTGSAAQ